MLRVDSIPSERTLASFYLNTYSLNRDSYAGEEYLKVIRRRALAQRKILSQYIGLAGSSVLDYGCGYGSLLNVLRSCGATTYGIDYDTKCIKTIIDNGHYYLEPDFDYENALPQKWNVVCLSHALEHVREPERLLRYLSRHSPLIFIEVPKYTRFLQEQFIDQEGHLWFFSEKGLRALVEKAGLRIVASSSAGPPLNLFWSGLWGANLLRKILRRVTGDYFFNMYSFNNYFGIWIRLIAARGD